MFSLARQTADPELGRPKSELDAGSLSSLAESCVKEFIFFDLRVLIKTDRAEKLSMLLDLWVMIYVTACTPKTLNRFKKAS